MTTTAQTTTPSRPATSFVIPSLDGIRAVSIVLVFMAHSGYKNLVPGGFGVTIFFFLSGFLITTLLRREFARHGRIDLVAFYKRRAWRILPPMYLCLGFATVAALTGLTATRPSPSALLAQIGHLTNYLLVINPSAKVPDGTYAYWSLAIEEHFYLVYPALAAFLMRRYTPRRQAAVVLAVCGLVLAWRCALIYGWHVGSNRTYLATDTRIDAIGLGCVMALGFNPALDPVQRLARRPRTALLLLALSTLVLTLVIRNQAFRETFRYSIQSVALAPIFYLAIVHHDDWPFAWLNVRWVRFLGVLSYAFYLTHQTFIYLIEKHTRLPHAAVIVTSFTVSVAFAWLVHLVVERPVGRIRHRLSKV